MLLPASLRRRCSIRVLSVGTCAHALGFALACEFDFGWAALVLGAAVTNTADVHIPRGEAALCRLQVVLLGYVRDCHCPFLARLAAHAAGVNGYTQKIHFGVSLT